MPDWNKLAHLLIDSDEYWEGEDLIPPSNKEKEALKTMYPVEQEAP